MLCDPLRSRLGAGEILSGTDDVGFNILPRSALLHQAHIVTDAGTITCPVEEAMEETIEFEALDALPPFDDSGNIAWSFEGGPLTSREKRWLELYLKKGS